MNAEESDDLEGVNRVFRETRELADDLDERLAEFVEGHPVFSERFGLYDENLGDGTPSIDSWEWRNSTATTGEPSIGSEWECAVAWGYKEGLLDVAASLDGLTSVPFAELED